MFEKMIESFLVRDLQVFFVIISIITIVFMVKLFVEYIVKKKEKDVFWEEVNKFLKANDFRIGCMSGWNMQQGSTSIGYYADAVPSIKNKISEMKKVQYFISDQFYIIRGFLKNEKIEFSMQHSY